MLENILKARFEAFPKRHPDISWDEVKKRLDSQPEKMRSLQMMEDSGGQPDVVGRDPDSGDILFMDCAPESPEGRRSLCYDQEALNKRKENKPRGSAQGMAEEMGISLLTEAEYLLLQSRLSCDSKTSSWILTPPGMRNLGGALFGDARYGRVFFYHNGAESYYAGRGFRGVLRV